ncbi:MAG: VCBS repeat-containing protein [Pyrinomonadaceae bacterium]
MRSNNLFNQLRRGAALLAVVGMLSVGSLVIAQTANPGKPVRPEQTIYASPKAGHGGIVANTASATDFTGDGMNDLVYFDQAQAQWEIHNVAAASVEMLKQGTPLGVPVAADYDGDGVMDIAMVRPDGDGSMCWEVRLSRGGTTSILWGLVTDVPVKGDYDGDGHSDLAVFRPGTGQWLAFSSLTGTLIELQMTVQSSDLAVPGDYDGDQITDPAVFRLAETTFYYVGSSDQSLHVQGWEPMTRADEPSLVPADYDGDGTTDFAVFTPHDGIWRILLSRTGSFFVQMMPVISVMCPPQDPACQVRDFAQPSDLDNDGIADPAIWTPKENRVSYVGSQVGEQVITLETGEAMTSVSAYYVR